MYTTRAQTAGGGTTLCKKSGVILLEAVFALILLGMVTYGFAATGIVEVAHARYAQSNLQAQQFAEMEAMCLKGYGFDDVDSQGVHSRRNTSAYTGRDDGYETITTLIGASTVGDTGVKLLNVAVYKKGESSPCATQQVAVDTNTGGSTLPKTLLGIPDWGKASCVISIDGTAGQDSTEGVGAVYKVPKNGYIFTWDGQRDKDFNRSWNNHSLIKFYGTPIVVAAPWLSGRSRLASSVIPVNTGDTLNLVGCEDDGFQVRFVPFRTE